MDGWAVSLAGCAFLFGVFVGFFLDGESGCERAAQEYFLSVQIDSAAEATEARGIDFTIACDLPLFPKTGPTVTPTAGP